jgi:hypothetical protein
MNDTNLTVYCSGNGEAASIQSVAEMVGYCTGLREIYTIEWTQTGVKVMRCDREIVKKWGESDGKCKEKNVETWKIRNCGSTVLVWENFLGANLRLFHSLMKLILYR